MKPLRFTISRIGEPTLEEYTAAQTPLDSPASVVEFWRALIAARPEHEPDKEHLIVIQTNTRLRPVGWNLVAVGTLNECVAHPREILRPTVLVAAHGFMLVHNHPSGDPTPSEADRRLTRRVSEASELLQIKFFDHLIIGSEQGNAHFSFRENGIL